MMLDSSDSAVQSTAASIIALQMQITFEFKIRAIQHYIHKKFDKVLIMVNNASYYKAA